MDHCAISKALNNGDGYGNVLVFRNEVGQPVAVPERTVLENDRTYRAYQLHERGKSWAEVAVHEGYDNARQAMYEVQRWLDEGRALISERTRRDMLQTEIARLDRMQDAIWDDAIKGKIPAVREVTNLVITRIKVLKLDEMREDEEQITGPRTVIVPQDDGGYLEVLQGVASEGPDVKG